MSDRSTAMCDAFVAGQTMEEIGQQHGISRERVRQILKADWGIVGSHGGAHLRAASRAAERHAAREQRTLKRLGCTWSDYVKVRSLGAQMMRCGCSREVTPLGAFGRLRQMARDRNVEFKLKFWDFWICWQNSGKWDLRGRGHSYCLTRKSVDRPYTSDNIEIRYIPALVSEVRVRHGGTARFMSDAA